MTEISEILAKLDPKTRQRVQAAVEVETLKQKTPSIGLNLALKGGFGHGRQILVWGNKSAGKSSFCLQMIAEAQKEGKTCAWIDAEHSYSQEWAEKRAEIPTEIHPGLWGDSSSYLSNFFAVAVSE